MGNDFIALGCLMAPWICSSYLLAEAELTPTLSRVAQQWTLAACHLWILLELARQDLLRGNFLLRDVLRVVTIQALPWKNLSQGIKEGDHTVDILPCRFSLLFFTLFVFSLCFLWNHIWLPFPQVVCKDFPRPPLESTINYLEAGQLSSFFRNRECSNKPLQVVVAGAGLT
jgi:hypothetical protein